MLRIPLDGIISDVESSGKVWIEPLLGGGAVYEVAVTGTNTAATTKYRSFVPGLAAGN